MAKRTRPETGSPRFPQHLLHYGLALGALILLAAGAVVVAGALGYGPAWLRDIAWPFTPKVEGIDPKALVDPGRQYHLTVWDYRLPFVSAGGAAFSTATDEAIRRFELRHPNVTVDLVLVDTADGPAKLEQALAAGYPPDVYCSPYGNPATGSNLQIPAGLYLDYDTWARYDPVAWQATKVGGTIWAFPRFMLLWPWVGNGDLLTRAGLDPARISAEGWTRAELASALAALAASGGQGGATAELVTTSPASVLRDLLLPGHVAAPEAPPAAAYWSGPEAAAVVGWLADLRAGGALTGEASESNPVLVETFLHGRAAVLASPSPWVTDYLLDLEPRPQATEYALPPRKDRPSFVLLPPPHDAGQPSLTWVSVATVSVFRQARYKGDDNSRLAAELALELTTGLRPWLRNEALCVPVDLSEQASWQMRAERFGAVGTYAARALTELRALPTERLGLALEALTYGALAPTTGNQAPLAAEVSPAAPGSYLGPYVEEAVAPAVARFWEGQETPEELLAELAGSP